MTPYKTIVSGAGSGNGGREIMSEICSTCKKPKVRSVVVSSVVGHICPECGWMEGQTLPTVEPAVQRKAPIGVVTAKMIIRFDGRTGSTHMTDREHWGELMAEQINAAQPPTLSATADLRELIAKWRKRKAGFVEMANNSPTGYGRLFGKSDSCGTCADELEAALAQADRSGA